MQQLMSKSEIVYGIRQLNVSDRLSVITYIWDEIKESHELETVSEDERRLLLNRLGDYRANPDSATDWTELRQEIYKKKTYRMVS
ncbi:Dihydropteroate synthase [Desulfamplus magnetovallimortis]|uniref:Dihydropteroate synthase n=1 Tax=Desulfamplus magnetovallimortis TaxID=1246637 RepID=A0A1W1HID1_9BACT|nr:addiction module protein [Desulfamplus magnetovallimortis]SLM32142.1 Dihydropteroate synthase [Desulfamplus magnetovallimortis]